MKWIMRGILVLFAAALLIPLTCSGQAPADTTKPTALQAIFVPPVRDSLARAWSDSDPHQVERYACLSFTVERAPVNVLRVTLTGFVDADTVFQKATPYSIGFRCPRRTLSLHTHPPVSCPMLGAFDHDWAHCVAGGNSAYLCFASDQDKKALAYEQKDVAFIQCDRHAVVIYFPAIPPKP